MAPSLGPNLLGALVTSLLSLTSVFISWEHVQLKVIDVNGATAVQSWDAGSRATATALASATLACVVLCAAVNLWGAWVLFEAVTVSAGSEERREAAARSAASTAAGTQAVSCLLAFFALALFGRRLYVDRAQFSTGDVRGDAGYALVVAAFFVSLGLLLRQGVLAARAAIAAAAHASSQPPAPPATHHEGIDASRDVEPGVVVGDDAAAVAGGK